MRLSKRDLRKLIREALEGQLITLKSLNDDPELASRFATDVMGIVQDRLMKM